MSAISYADRVKDTTTSTGTGNITLSGTAPTGYQDFNTAFGTSVHFYYVIEGGTEWETGIGHLSAATTLVRDVVLNSTNANAAVNFSAGTKNVFCTIPGSNFPSWRMIVKGATESRNTTTTVADDAVLIVPIPANGNAQFRWCITMYSEGAGGFKYSIVIPAGAVSGGVTTTRNNTTMTQTGFTSTPTNVGLAMNGVTGHIIIEQLVTTAGTAGDVKFQWAQNSSNGTNTHVTGSRVEWTSKF